MVYQKRGHENCILENNVDTGSFLSQSITKLLSQISIYGNLHRDHMFVQNLTLCCLWQYTISEW